jgi:hypothetical protein
MGWRQGRGSMWLVWLPPNRAETVWSHCGIEHLRQGSGRIVRARCSLGDEKVIIVNFQ